MNQALLITSSAIYAFLGSIIPVLIWLWFWLREDPHPEPRKVVIRTFFAGVAIVPIALFFETIAIEAFKTFGLAAENTFPFLLLFIWASIEEYGKYAAARWGAFSRQGFEEPIDAPIYMITAALGFAAFENGIFLFRAFSENPLLGLITGQLRFLGATLLHVTASGLFGAIIAFAFFHRENMKKNIQGGFFTATLLHTFFNFFILKQGSGHTINIFIAVWILAFMLIIIFERVKRLRPSSQKDVAGIIH